MLTFAAILLWWACALSVGLATSLLAWRQLRCEEHLVCGLVVGLIEVTFLSMVTAFGGVSGPKTLLTALVCGLVGAGVIARWGWAPLTAVWSDARGRIWIGGLWQLGLVTLVAAVFFGIVFGHVFIQEQSGIYAGFSTAWSDWSLHTANVTSFVLGKNFPPQNPIYSGTPLTYPFASDFNSALYYSLGSGINAALEVPSAVVMTALTLIVVMIGHRLCKSYGAGSVAMLLMLFAGSLAFGPFLAAACSQGGHGACMGSVESWPADVIHTLVGLPYTLTHQSYFYDGLGDTTSQLPITNLQWQTPLMVWWIPQRDYAYGVAVAALELLVLVTHARDKDRQWWAFGVAGVLGASLVLVQIQIYVCCALVAPIYALTRRRKEWWLLLGCALGCAIPRLVLLAGQPHGSAALGNVYPWISVGWMVNTNHVTLTVGHVLQAIPQFIDQLFSVKFWVFWLTNLGVLIPMMIIVPLASLGLWVRKWEGSDLKDAVWLLFPLGLLAVLANIFVLQSWVWDDTKFFGFAILFPAMFLGIGLCYRGFAWPIKVAAGTGVVLSLLTALTVLVRLLPTTPAAYAAGPYLWQSTSEVTMAAKMAAQTSPSAVIVATGSVTDAPMSLSGRPVLMGYSGWLWSYGLNYTARSTAMGVIIAGCMGAPTATCPAVSYMRQYHVSYVEVVLTSPTLPWWLSQEKPRFSDDSVDVFDVRQWSGVSK